MGITTGTFGRDFGRAFGGITAPEVELTIRWEETVTRSAEWEETVARSAEWAEAVETEIEL
jgi:hypothetical protein